jgi:putative transposase
MDKRERVSPAVGYVALRRGRISNPGHAYLVTTVVKGREPLFANWTAASVACRIWNQELNGSQFLAWVLMPDHFHGVLQLGEQTSLSDVMQRYKGRVAATVNRQLARSGPLWQDGFHDHALRREEDLRQIAWYIVENPLRAGLTSTLGNYPYWNLDWV